MTRRRLLPLCAAVFVVSGCYHQVVTTGRTAGATTIDKPWVSGWLWGLVPAEDIDVRRECPGGVAVVTTETSFMNGLVSAITIGIYTPQHVTITCASGTASVPRGANELRIPVEATAEESARVFDHALELAGQRSAPVVIRYESLVTPEDR